MEEVAGAGLLHQDGITISRKTAIWRSNLE
jgi:hypothetical protein